MKAIVYNQNLPATDPLSLYDTELPTPTPGENDLLIAVKAVSVNPVDTKIRRNVDTEGQPRVLGWDAAGVVVSVGSAVTGFQAGDEVWYAGAIDKPGSNSEFQLVDQRIVSHKPRSLSFSEAAALPLTAITAWELLFDRLELHNQNTKGKSLLVIGAAGGVGSVLLQLARQKTQLKVIGTASRAQSKDWVKSLGADVVLDHRKPMAAQLKELGLAEVDYVISLTHTDHHFNDILELIKPQGKLALIDDPEPIDVRQLKRKSVSLHWELMFTRSLYQTEDMNAQQQLLQQVADMVDAGQLQTTLSADFGQINAENLRRAHQLIESQQSIGKLVLSGF
ncbi:MAG: zinc-binding alcohol dehydrogenase family protein [Gammaproteobacteria bacterium]|nr:zinc-binding alcohol dehydrogenase family protein [Gammaproteobacteria bacterium]MBU2057584.1 zinc-binding alcohol dehydrogenase family protein [Gammaproteobacteria bacterium]MBU2176344.1 zinc-binding alcohol dehydrogenase family protein [Gammaproteobacteria bacterium]MBU2245945.1 zinc-binding alcohol dehydrogenase family protein [Gammaproteobacteria bacterium]MBU2345480.1 zinc-binding alcohol dehydrogenase family protein [Gammaproteobacteria bacterium]